VVLAPLPLLSHRPRAPDLAHWYRGMNTTLTAYTHLESLLLFQSLSVYGLANNAFGKISELLKNNPSITSDRRFQSGRLSPDALRNFCLHLLKEEERSEQRQGDRVDGEVQNGEVRNARKRKAPSPSFPTVQEATQHAHLIPKLVNKLYARYRTALTNEIRDEEERYDRLQRELQSIERGERDAELLERVNGKSPVPPSPRQPLNSPLLHQKPVFPSPSVKFPMQGHVPVPTRATSATPVPPLQPSSAEGQKSPAPLNGSMHVDSAKQPSDTNHRQDFYPAVSQPRPLQMPYPQVSTPIARPQQPVVSTPSSTSTIGRQSLPQLQPPSYRPVDAFSTPPSVRTPHSDVSTPRLSFPRWKPSTRPIATPLVSRPQWESVDDSAPQAIIPAKPTQSKAKPPRKEKGNGKAKAKESEKEPEKEEGQEDAAQIEVATHDRDVDQVSEMETRQGRSRRTGFSKSTRPPSLASSRAGGSVRGRSRSQSIMSHAETPAAEIESQAGTRIKDERRPSIDVHMADETMGAPSQPVVRGRGGASPSKGRKRTAREASIAESEEHVSNVDEPSGAATAGATARVVIAPRNFSRMCNPIMNDIASHKHASTFNTAVKAKNAEGYYDIIKRPTDLKSIRQAITAGAKVVAAAASSISDTPNANGGSTPSGSSSGFIELPLSEDSVPPKVIVNSAQLEHELMRMFANAVMFNPGEEGVVEDAREMFESCQEAVSNWRSSAERSMMALGAGSGVAVAGEETPATGAQTPADDKEREDGPAASKRRKA
ncbi:uncharacterized protein EI97DRAFT_367399, partial [Westerdykella ornata]